MITPNEFHAIRTETLGLKQTELAERLGIDRSYISELENGRRPISHQIGLLMLAFADGWTPRPRKKGKAR